MNIYHKMSLYVIIDSDESVEYFSDNVPYKFKSKLNQTLTFNGDWKVALLEISVPMTIPMKTVLYIYSNLCGESIINGACVPLLRRVVLSSTHNIIFTEPIMFQ